MQLMPHAQTFTETGSFDIKGGSARTLYAWGDFAGGRLVVQAVVPHDDGEKVFDLTDEGSYVEQAIDEDAPETSPHDDEEPMLELTDKGFIHFQLRSPIVRVSLLDCSATPDVKIWLG